MKKFYKLVSVAQSQNGFLIHLDNKPVKTPSGAVLTVPTQALADEVVKEWAAQENEILPDTMPLTQIMTTAQDHVLHERAAITDKILQYLQTDLLCYRAELPQPLAERQAACWDQWLNWFEKTYSMALETTTGLQALRQPEAAHKQVTEKINAMDDLRFCVLQLVTNLSGSLVLALAFTEGAATPDHVFEAANIEEIYKAEIYNEAEHGAAPLQEKKQEAMKRDLVAARKFLDFI